MSEARARALARKRGVDDPGTAATSPPSARTGNATLARRVYDLSVLGALGMIQLVWMFLVAFGVFSFLR